MDGKIPLPTDNIYKFYALFGLALFIFGLASTIYTTKATNQEMVAWLVELETLNGVASPSPVENLKKDVLRRHLEVAKFNRQVFRWGNALLVNAGLFTMLFGFWRWHRRIQPIQDEIADLHLRKLRKEVELLEAPPKARRLDGGRRSSR